MPINKKAYRRYKIIDRLLLNTMKPFPSMDEIIQKCEDKLDIRPSSETIQKDIANMRLPHPDGFDAPIKYSRSKDGYSYTNPEFSIEGIALNSTDIDTIKEAVDLLASIGRTGVGSKFNHAMEKVLSTSKEEFPDGITSKKIIQTDTPVNQRGFEHFDLLFAACREELPVTLIHYSYRNQKFKSLTVHPVLLKEFDNRWYVVGYSEHHDGLRTFGFDRIYEPLLTRKKFIKASRKETDIYFNDVYGVYPLTDKKEIVSIHASPLATNYLQAYPLHDSQTIEKKNYGDAIVSWDLIPSMELLRMIISYGKQVKVKEPNWLMQKIEKLK